MFLRSSVKFLHPQPVVADKSVVLAQNILRSVQCDLIAACLQKSFDAIPSNIERLTI